jgi:gamma-F420-2:alpha-L-glutamate ligase
MKGWILYKRCKDELTEGDHGVNRFLSIARDLQIELDVFKPGQFSFIASDKKDRSIFLHGEPVDLPDFIIPRIGAETTDYALALIRQFEFHGVYMANSAKAIETVKDKMRVCQLMMANNLPSPNTMILDFPVPFELINREIGFPLVIKNIAGARGIGVHLCETTASFKDLIELFGTPLNPQLIVQQFIAGSYGRDLRVFVLGNKVIGCMQRTAKDSFKANYSLGGNVESFPISSEIERLALECTKLVGLEIAGIDLLFGEDGYLICEANSSPGFKGMELASGDDIATKILTYVVKKVKSRARNL